MAFYNMVPVMGTVKAVAETVSATQERGVFSKARIEGVYGMTGEPCSNRTLLLMLLYFVTRLKGRHHARLGDLCRDFVWLSDELFSNIAQSMQKIRDADAYNPVLKAVYALAQFAFKRQKFADFKYDMLKMRHALDYAAYKGQDRLPEPISEMADMIFNRWKDNASGLIGDWERIFNRNF